MFEYMLSYSPYHNVKETEYPSIYIQTGEMDNNVPPYHGKKFAAKMQELNQSDNPVLLRVLAEGSHDRGQGEVYWKTTAEMQLFAEKALGLKGERKMTPEEYYNAHEGIFHNVLNTQHILVETKEEADSMLERINNGEDMAKLAEEYSMCPSGKESGGDLGFFPNGLFVEPYETAAHALKNIGDITGPVKSQFGYHIIKLLGRKDVLTLDECRDTVQMIVDHEAEENK